MGCGTLPGMSQKIKLRRKKTFFLIFITAGGILCVTLFLRYDGHYFHVFKNYEASCANCRRFIQWNFMDYAEQNDGWLPRNGNTPLDSLAKCIKEEKDVHLFTSHTWARDLKAYWQKHGTLSPEFTCYRYNEGLREDDSAHLIVLYYYKPTRWGSWEHKMKEIGRPVMFNDNSWHFLSEDEFQERQRETQRFILRRASKSIEEYG